MTAKTEAEQLIEEAKRHDKAATPGPWERCVHHPDMACSLKVVQERTQDTVARMRCESDGDFLVWARTALPKMAEMLTKSLFMNEAFTESERLLVQRADSLRAEAKRYREALEICGRAGCPTARDALTGDDHEQG